MTHHYLLPLQLATVAAARFGSLRAPETTALSPGHTAPGDAGARDAGGWQFSATQRTVPPGQLLLTLQNPGRCHPVWAVTAVQEPAGLNEEGQGVPPTPQATVQSLGSFSCRRNIAQVGPRSGQISFLLLETTADQAGAWDPSSRNHTPPAGLGHPTVKNSRVTDRQAQEEKQHEP